jgi:hypothetical protein
LAFAQRERRSADFPPVAADQGIAAHNKTKKNIQIKFDYF